MHVLPRFQASPSSDAVFIAVCGLSPILEGRLHHSRALVPWLPSVPPHGEGLVCARPLIAIQAYLSFLSTTDGWS